MSEENRPSARLSRRTLLKAGVGVTAAAGLSAVGMRPADAGLNSVIAANARRVWQFTGTGPKHTAKFGVPFVDLCIPVRTGKNMLYVGGDAYGSNGVPGDPTNDWRTPVGLICDIGDPYPQNTGTVITEVIGDPLHHADAFVDQDGVRIDGDHPDGRTTVLPSDVFAASGALWLHLMRGPLHEATRSELWTSTDYGRTWRYVRQWPASLYDGQFVQKSYASTSTPSYDDPYVYVVSTKFDRTADSDLLLFRVHQTDLSNPDDEPDGYEPYGYRNGAWAWGNPPTTINDRRLWGEICFRHMPVEDKWALSWFQPNREHPELADIRAQVLTSPTADLFAAPEQTMVYQSIANPYATSGSVLSALYGGFILPGSTFENFNIIVSRWDQNEGYEVDDNYCCLQYRTSLTV